jgi:hypothetical protein
MHYKAVHGSLSWIAVYLQFIIAQGSFFPLEVICRKNHPQ